MAGARQTRVRNLRWALVVAMAGAAAFPLVGALAGPGYDLPDLVADAPERPLLAEYTYPDGTEALLLRFDGFVHNRGAGPLEVRGSDRSGADMTTVRQWARRTGRALEALTPVNPAAIRYETADGHNHWHLREIARYSLWNAARTAEVIPAQKVGFCLEDGQRIETNGPSSQVYSASANFCLQNQPTASAVTMGISAGWRDVYGRHLAMQWVDVSGVQPGVYRLAAEVDTKDVVQEADEVNSRTFEPGDSVIPGHRALAVNRGDVPAGQASTVTLAAQTFVRPARTAWNEPGVTPGAVRFRIVSPPARGTLRSGTTALAAGSVVSSADVTYTPAAGYTGPDGFTFSAFDSTSPFPRTPATASVSLTVGAQTPRPTVAISGAPAELQTGASAQLSATVTDAPAGVAWSVNGVAGGDATVGTITSAGLYTAPASVPPGGSVTVRATSTSDPTAFDEVPVAIVAAPPPEPAPGNVLVNPSFESGTAGWTSYQGAVARELQTGAPDGQAVARVAWRSGGFFTIDDGGGSLRSTTPGVLYTATAWVRAASASSAGKRVSLKLREHPPAGAIAADVSSPALTLTGAWQKLMVTHTTSTTGGSLGVRVSHDAAASGDAMYVDAFSLTGGTGAPPANTPPTASITASPSAPQIGQAVTFTDASTDADGTIVARAWDLDDDGQYDDGTGATATRAFSVAGAFTIRLRVTDDDGAAATTSRQVTVSAPPPAGANLLTNPSFEGGLAGWGGWQATLARVAQAGAPDGGWFARATRSTGTSFTIDDSASSITSTVAGRTYTATAWVRAGSAESVGGPVQLKLRERTSGGTTVADVGSPQVTLTGSWQKLTVNRTAAAGGNRLGVRVSVGNAAAGSAVDADLFVVTGSGP